MTKKTIQENQTLIAFWDKAFALSEEDQKQMFENPDYPDIPVTDCQIQGVAVYVLKSLGASPLRRRR